MILKKTRLTIKLKEERIKFIN